MGTVSCWARAQSRGGGEQWFSCTWIVAVVWWLIVGRDTPEDHPRWAYHGGADDVSGGIKQGIQATKSRIANVSGVLKTKIVFNTPGTFAISLQLRNEHLSVL
eukprot:178551_1